MDDAAYMQRAIRLARRGLGAVEPNPMVGCVLVRPGGAAAGEVSVRRGGVGGVVVGEGWHKRFGGPHAEIEALRKAGDQARGATCYVTLEPCNHHGKTPPCTRALIDAGVSRVVIGCVEPTAEREGRGIAELEAAGITVQLLPTPDASRLIEPFAKRQLLHLPYVIAKWASTLDGAIATQGGDSKWISGERSRRLVHQLRGRVDAIITGIGTVDRDDPLLTARDVKVRRVARRVVIDPNLRIADDRRLIATADKVPLTLAVADPLSGAQSARAAQLESQGIEIVRLPRLPDSPSLDLRPLMRCLHDSHAATNVLVEGGGRTIGSMIAQNLVDELMVFIAPKLLGDGRHRPPAVLTQEPRRSINDARPLELVAAKRIGDDLLLNYRLPHR